MSLDTTVDSKNQVTTLNGHDLDIYNFINKGFSFETGDKMLRLAADACIECTGKDVKIGRFEHTKIGIILEQFEDEKIEELTQILWEKIIGNIRKLNVDKIAITISYTGNNIFKSLSFRKIFIK